MVVTVRVAMVMAMIMRVIIVMVVMIAMVMAMMIVVMMLVRRRIGAAFRIERCLDRGEPCAERRQHRFERAVALQSQPVGEHLNRHVPVTEMPGEPRQMRQVVAAHLDQRGSGSTTTSTRLPSSSSSASPGAQQRGLGQHEADRGAVHAGQMPGLDAPLRGAEDDAVTLARDIAIGGTDHADDTEHVLVQPCRALVLGFSREGTGVCHLRCRRAAVAGA